MFIVTLSKCFEKYPEYFDNVYVNLIKAGEASGKLDVFLLKIVDSLEKKEKIKKKIKGALMYPGIMFSVAITVSAFMLIKVVPVFAKMYDGMGIALPKPTAVIMAMSDFLRGSGGLIMLISIIVFVFGFRYLTTKNATIQYKLMNCSFFQRDAYYVKTNCISAGKHGSRRVLWSNIP